MSTWPSAVLRPAVSTLFSRSSWLPVLSTDERNDDLASTSLENSCKPTSKKMYQKNKAVSWLNIFIAVICISLLG